LYWTNCPKFDFDNVTLSEKWDKLNFDNAHRLHRLALDCALEHQLSCAARFEEVSNWIIDSFGFPDYLRIHRDVIHTLRYLHRRLQDRINLNILQKTVKSPFPPRTSTVPDITVPARSDSWFTDERVSTDFSYHHDVPENFANTPVSPSSATSTVPEDLDSVTYSSFRGEFRDISNFDDTVISHVSPVFSTSTFVTRASDLVDDDDFSDFISATDVISNTPPVSPITNSHSDSSHEDDTYRFVSGNTPGSDSDPINPTVASVDVAPANDISFPESQSILGRSQNGSRDFSLASSYLPYCPSISQIDYPTIVPVPSVPSDSSMPTTGFMKKDLNEVHLRDDRFFAVVNLTDSDFTDAEYSLLSKGLNYCPTPAALNLVEIERDLARWEVSMRRKEWFSDPLNVSPLPVQELDLSDDSTRNYRIFRPPSRFVPSSDRSERLNLYISTVRNSILSSCSKVTRSDFHNNLASSERTAMSCFQFNNNVVIKEADKGSAVVIIDSDRYKRECLRHLNDGSYRLLDHDPTPQFEVSLHKLIASLTASGILTKDMASFASTPNSRPARFYCLPKIHKRGVPGRPVCSCSGSLCENSSIIIDWFLKPLLTTIPSYLRDSYDFLDRLHAYGPLPADSFLVTLDVVSLYPSIPHQDGLSALRTFLNDSRFDSRFIDGIVQLSEFILQHNFFVFDNQFYLQTKGTAIGTTMAVVYAVIFMHIFETGALSQSRLRPALWLRFIDDIFMVWPHSEASLADFVHYLNSINSSIQFTYSCSKSSIDFLDIVVSKDSCGTVSTDLYIKNTDTHQFLHNLSCHPGHVKRSLAFSQTLRYRRICSSEERARFHSSNLEKFLVLRQYGRRSVRAQIEKAFRQDLSVRRSDTSDNDRVNMILTFHPGLPNISGKLRELHEIITVDPRLSNAFPLPPRVSFRRPKTIRDKIVRACLPSTATSTPNFCGPCLGRANCQLCLLLPHQESIFSKSGREFRLNCGVDANCKSVFVIYCITCMKCQSQYVGCTSNFRKRANQHKSIISRRLAKPECFRLYQHFSANDHSISDVRFTILSRTVSSKLEEEENIWKNRLNSIYPNGLNVTGEKWSNRF
jgi:hypothetical protein